MDILVQRIEFKYSSEFERAKKYYAIILELNDMKVTPKELELIAFSATRGTFSTPPVREEFSLKYNTPRQSIYNMLAKLQKQRILIKDRDNKVRVNPALQMDFTKDFVLQIKVGNAD